MHSTAAAASTDIDFANAVEAAKLAALYNFAYGLSHEINNPLANIATRAQTLLVEEKNPERRRKLATIVQQSFRAHEMIADLMLFARPPTIRPEMVDLVALVDTVLGEMQEQAHEQATDLTRAGSSTPLIANIDRTQIAVALKAIIQNGLEAVREGGSVTVLAESRADFRSQVSNFKFDSAHKSVPAPNLKSESRNSQSLPCVVLSICDSGPGIPDHIRPHIFDPYYSGREAGRGLGLGLSKAWRIIDLHGGRFDVDSTDGQGTRFTIALPVGA